MRKIIQIKDKSIFYCSMVDVTKTRFSLKSTSYRVVIGNHNKLHKKYDYC